MPSKKTAAQRRQEVAARSRAARIASGAAPQRSPRPAAQTKAKAQAKPQRALTAEPEPWSRRSTYLLLVMVIALQLPINVGIHLTQGKSHLWEVDLVNVQPLPLLASFLALMPLVQRIAKERRMRLLENLSLGVIYLLVWWLAVGIFVRPVQLQNSTDPFASFTSSDAVSIGATDLIALIITGWVFPTVYRVLWMPQKRAIARRERAEERARRRAEKES